MKNKALLEEIAKNTTIVEYHIKRLKKKPDQLHEIDIDLLTEKLKTLYSLVHELKTGKAVSFPEQEKVETAEVNESVTEDAVIDEVLIENGEIQEMIVESEEQEEEIEVKTAPPAPIKEEVKEEVEEVKEEIEEEKEEVEEIKEEVEAELKKEMEDRTEEVPELKIPDPAPEAKAEPPKESQAKEEIKPKTTADLFTGTTTIADSLKKEEDTSIAAKGRQQPIDDLKKAIGINDKFLFINELFKGDPGSYNNVIDELNTAEALSDASKLMNDYTTEYSWSEDGPAYQRLSRLVEAKFL